MEKRCEHSLRVLCDEMAKISPLNEVKTVSSDNVFSIFEVINKEVPYCRVLSYLICECWPSFEKEVLGSCCSGEKLQQCVREYFCGAPCLNYNKEGRIDILLQTEQHVVAIEVKVGAGEQENQLIRYSRALNADYPTKKKHIFFLTTDGHAPITDRCTKECVARCKTTTVNISFNEHICKWLKGLYAGSFYNPIVIQFLEVLKMSQNGSEQTQQYLKILEQSREYPKLIQALSKVLPEFWGKIRADFLEKLTEELCSDRYGFRKTVSNQPFENEIWAERLQKDGKELCLCYETNFFVRAGEENQQWTYISNAAFRGSREDSFSYCSKKADEAFSLKGFNDSNDALVEWYYDQERYSEAIPCIAQSANYFFEKVNTDILKRGQN